MRNRATGAAVAVVLAVTIAAALYVMGSPDAERTRRLDRRRAGELAQLSGAIDVFWTRNSRLPSALADLREQQGSGVAIVDPVSGVQYEYRALAATSFELCANFTMDSNDGVGDSGFWAHRAGRQCFRRDARESR